MDDILHILPTYSTPEVIVDIEKGGASIVGKSVPEDSMSFYKPVIAFLEHYREKPVEAFHLRVALEYFNSNSSKFILDFFLKVAKLLSDGVFKKVNIDWVVDPNDEDMIEAGEDYMAIVKLPFNIVHK